MRANLELRLQGGISYFRQVKNRIKYLHQFQEFQSLPFFLNLDLLVHPIVLYSKRKSEREVIKINIQKND